MPLSEWSSRGNTSGRKDAVVQGEALDALCVASDVGLHFRSILGNVQISVALFRGMDLKERDAGSAFARV